MLIQTAWDELFLLATRIKIAGSRVVESDRLDAAELRVETTTIMFADVVESVRLIEQDETGNVSRIRSLLGAICDSLAPLHCGIVLERRGDGLLVKFADPRNAAAFAIAAHAKAVLANDGAPIGSHLLLRIGIHTAKLLSAENALYGQGINAASRITALANPGETAISAEARDQLTDGVDGELVDLGDCIVKNLSNPLRVFRLGPAGPSSGPPDAHQLQMGRAIPTLAVIPMKMKIGAPEHAYVGELIAETIVVRLSRAQSLRIVSRLSSSVFRDIAPGTSEIGRRLGADYLLSGTYSVSGGRVSAYCELADGSTSVVVWADHVRGDVQALFEDDCELADRIATEIQVRVIDHQMARLAEKPLPTLQSYTMFLGGLSLMHRQSETDFNRARELFEYLKDRHPRNAVPRAWLGKWHMLKIVQGWSTDLAAESRNALIEASRALEIEPKNSLCSTVKGVVHAYLQKDFTQATECFDFALLCNPNDALARLQRAALSGWIGDADTARDSALEALRLSPLDPHLYFLHSLVAGAFLGAGEYELAESHARQSIRANCMHVATYKVLAMAQCVQGKAAEANTTVSRLMKLSPDFSTDQFAVRSPWVMHPRFEDLRHALAEAGVPKTGH